jgi:UDP:flavonoid glycosyltransferase YjiC (YdhE family)
MKRLTFLCFGSRGDVQPYVALGVGFKKAGYVVQIATHEIFKELVEQHGLEFALVKGNPRALLERDATRETLKTGANVIRMTFGFRKMVESVLAEMLESALDACSGSDALLYGLMGIPAYHLADKWNIPRFPMLLQPTTRTGEFPSLDFPNLALGPGYNKLTWYLGEQLFWVMLGQFANQWRHTALGLPSLTAKGQHDRLYRQRLPFTYGISEHVLPRPKDYPAWHRLVGYWFLDQSTGWTPPADLVEFINAGSLPIYVGFGSMNAGEAKQTTRIVLDALRITKQRAVFLKGWGGLHAEDLPDNVHMVETVPHEWLFPQVSCIVHHGGAGTTAAAFRAGVPQVVVPHFADQPFWAMRVHRLGVAPQPVYMKKLNATDLAGAITSTLQDREIQSRAKILGEAIRSEDGVTRAVELVNSYLEKGMEHVT